MTGMEVALTRLATTVVGAIVKSLLTPRPGAGLTTDPVRRLTRPAKPGQLVKVLGGRLTERYADLPENELLAALSSVEDSFASAGELTAERLFALSLDEDRLHVELAAPPAGLSNRAAKLYDELLHLCCTHVLEQFTTHPSFIARAAVEQTRAQSQARELVEDVRSRIGRRADAAALAFEQRYAEFTAKANSRMGLFGLTLGQSASEWPLETSYISLSVSGGGAGQDALEQATMVTVSVEQALVGTERLLLRGPAGSGKSTFVQWLALNAAHRSFVGELGSWNNCVPFVLRLRAFTRLGTLPTPEEFLRASGVPMHGAAPVGWVDDVLSKGRGLVLVDGVDEVPMHLRQRAEKWLKDLVTAYPQSRYVVTTRPSAVSETWLSSSGFEAHSLLPMDRKDIDAFIGHWHAAGRYECESEDQREQLDVYEASLRRAVTARRDLLRLATNPLMCALLCALNRDRRTQLPRARKELYDAALDMLLVRRDTEREIVGVEGVDLTREEQTALLQRLAYWLIRNGQAETDCDEAISMISEWMTAMPHIRGTAMEVFSHLLIRSGLLREPAPGAVGFVHRTFQDYLGAKAAVEARDFGVLVRHAHDDQWHDVVQMAVAHARLDERARLLRQLLKRADRARKHRHRLVLLATASLEHAPELDPAVDAEVRRRTAELLPPRSWQEAEELAGVGDLILELLPGPEDEAESSGPPGWPIRTAAMVGGDAAYELIKRYRDDERDGIDAQLSDAWASFTPEPYARDILASRTWPRTHLTVANTDQMAALRYIPEVRSIRLTGNHKDLSPLASRSELNKLFVYKNRAVSDITPLASMHSITRVGLSVCPGIRDLSPLSELPLTWLSLVELHPAAPKHQLEPLTNVREFHLGHNFPVGSVGELAIGPHLTSLTLARGTGGMSMEGVERWSNLKRIRLYYRQHLLQMASNSIIRNIESMYLVLQEISDLDMLADCANLRTLFLNHCHFPTGLTPLRELHRLTDLYVYAHSEEEALDLAPLADLEDLTVHVGHEAKFTGFDSFPPERIARLY